MLIPSKRANLLRQAENPLFYNISDSRDYRIKVFWELLRPILGWIKDDWITRFNLLPDEAESELYLFCAYLFEHYKKDKSSIIPYLANFTYLYKTRIDNRLKKNLGSEIHSGLIFPPENIYFIEDEVYLTTPNILFNNKYLLKYFSISQKYVINEILISDPDITQEELAQKCNISRITLRKHIAEIKTIMEEFYGPRDNSKKPK